MIASLLHSSLGAFDSLPLVERLFVRARLFSAPLLELASEVRGPRVLDVGCGHGVLCAVMADGHPERTVVGIDPDPRKINWARRSIGRWPRTRFEVLTVERLAELEPGQFETITVADVLYLLPADAWTSFLGACHRLLVPGGQLLLKEAEDDGGWRARKALLQEKVMVALGRTHASGGLGFLPRENTHRALEAAGFHVDSVTSLARGSTTPHVLFAATSR